GRAGLGRRHREGRGAEGGAGRAARRDRRGARGERRGVRQAVRSERGTVRDPFSGPPLFSPSFLDALRAYAPDLLAPPPGVGSLPEIREGHTGGALRIADGVVMGGDRRATEGMSIVQNDLEKVFPADHFSAVAIAGAAGPAIEMVRLFQPERGHYAKR